MQGLHEKIRVAKPGGVVSAIACFCHSGNLPNYHGRYLPSDNHRVDALMQKYERVIRVSLRPKLLDVDHSIPSLDIIWQFKEAGLQDVQVNGHLALVSPGDSRIPVKEGAAYAIMRHQLEFDKLQKTRTKYGEILEKDGFSQDEFDELIELKQYRLEYLKRDPNRAKEMMEVFTQPLFFIKGIRPEQTNNKTVQGRI